MFQLLSSLGVHDGSRSRRISVYHGDLTQIPAEHAVDILVISAFPNAYHPTKSSLIGALDRAGVSVSDLARRKQHDLRRTSYFWLSHSVSKIRANLNFDRLACFESNFAGAPPVLVGDLFRGLFPFLSMTSDSVVAMPVLASGDQGYPKGEMFDAIIRGAAFWMSRGLGISELKIVERDLSTAQKLSDRLSSIDASLSKAKRRGQQFDIFLSYCGRDLDAANVVKRALESRADVGSVFDYRFSIDRGFSWQEKIDEAISSCRSVIAILTPDYFASVECQEELSQARLRHKREHGGVLLPVFWRSYENIALWIQTINMIDCRESNHNALVESLTLHSFSK